jgi:ABC-type phosphate/phosphonate transport system substrate-binding protein
MILASLPWYDLEAIRPATDELWRLFAKNLKKRGCSDVPQTLERETPYQTQWRSKRLLFSQACGYDALLSHRNHLRVIATPVYGAHGCVGPNYSSLIVVHAGSPARQLQDLRGTRAVINSPTSHSGMNALRALVAPLHCNGSFFSSISISGSHEGSLRMISNQSAEVASIDCVTYSLLQKHCPDALSAIRVLCSTPAIPAPPYVAGAGTPSHVVLAIRVALRDTFENVLTRPLRAHLLLDGIQFISIRAYQPIADWESQALKLGYKEMNWYSGHASALGGMCAPISEQITAEAAL